MPGPRRLASATARLVGAPSAMRTGVVQSVDATGVTVRIAGGNVLCGVLGSDQGVAPGATVAVFQQDSSWMVQGVVNGAGSGVTSSLILPGAQLLNSGNTYASGIGTGAEVTSNVVMSTGDAVVPEGHLIQLVMMVDWSITVANGQVGGRIRKGVGTGGTQVGSGHGFGPTGGFTYEMTAQGWFIGDGLPGQWTLTVQNFTGGTLSISSSTAAGNVCAAFDWGDGSGVSQF